jgi:hypothetical protein
LKGFSPQGVPKSYLQRLREYRGPTWTFLAKAGRLLGCSYRAQAFKAFDKYLFTASMALIIYCYGWVAGSKAQALSSSRDCSRSRCVMRGRTTTRMTRRSRCPERWYCIDSAKGASVVLISVLASQALMLETSPEIALPHRGLRSVDRDHEVGVAAEAGPSVPFQNDESLRRSPVQEDLVPEWPLDRRALRRVRDERQQCG